MALVDTSVLLDILNNDRIWANWSQTAFEAVAKSGPMVIDDVIYAELSTRFATVDEVDAAITGLGLQVMPIPRQALLLAGKAYVRYRSQSGTKTGVLPDFFVGAHAAVESWPLLTRDPDRVRSYFPSVAIIAP
jgi:predicted nucleic acid-binding protein